MIVHVRRKSRKYAAVIEQMATGIYTVTVMDKRRQDFYTFLYPLSLRFTQDYNVLKAGKETNDNATKERLGRLVDPHLIKIISALSAPLL